MVAVRTIFVRIVTAQDGTDGDVYLGIGGREFYIDSADPDINDFEAGSDRTYWMGEEPPLVPPDSQRMVGFDNNNPNKPQLDTDDLDKFPVYIRFEGHHQFDSWVLDMAEVRVNPVRDNQDKKYVDPGIHDEVDNEFFVLHNKHAQYVFLMPAGSAIGVTNVRTIFLRLVTSDIDNAGTDGDVYLGIGGVEFAIASKDPDFDDFKQGRDTTYWMGEEPPLVPPDSQECRGNFYKPYTLYIEKIEKFPVYIRFVGKRWMLSIAEVRVNPLLDDQSKKYIDPARHPPLNTENEYFILGREGFVFLMPADPVVVIT